MGRIDSLTSSTSVVLVLCLSGRIRLSHSLIHRWACESGFAVKKDARAAKLTLAPTLKLPIRTQLSIVLIFWVVLPVHNEALELIFRIRRLDHARFVP